MSLSNIKSKNCSTYWTSSALLSVVVSRIFSFSPQKLRKWSVRIFFKWVGSTSNERILCIRSVKPIRPAHTQFKQLAQPNGTITENLGNNEMNGEALARQAVVGTVASNRLPFHQNTCERKRSKSESVWYLVELFNHHENLLTLVTSLEWVWGSYRRRVLIKTSKRSEVLYWGFSATNIKWH